MRLVSLITITQQPLPDIPTRNQVYTLNFVNDIKGNSSWENMTDTFTLIFPKNVYVENSQGKQVSWQDKSITGGNNPIMCRGDQIDIQIGYRYFDSNNIEQLDLNTVFTGWISDIDPKMPIEITAMDNMYKLQQLSTPNKVFKASEYNLQSMLSEMLSGSEFVVNADSSVSIGDFNTLNDTVAQVLSRLKKDYQIYSYFRGNILYASALIYTENMGNDVNFSFQQNVPGSADLKYIRLDDIKIGVKVYSVNQVELTETINGKAKTKKKRLSVFITKDSSGNIIQTDESGFQGEKRTLYLWNIYDVNQLITEGGYRLNRFYYEGLRGSFDAFGLPFTQWGDNAILTDNILPERNGIYKVKSIDYSFGMEGFSQKIELDIRIDTLSQSQLLAGL